MQVDEGIRELVPDRLYALGTAFPLDGRVTWVPSAERGFQPTNCYVIRDGSSVMLVDPGPAYQGDVVTDQLTTLIGSGTALSVFLTRAEFDSFGALDAIGQAFPVRQVLSGGTINPFDSFGYVGQVGGATAMRDVELVRVPSGSNIPIAPMRELAVVDPVLRLLSTFWAYDSGAGALFCSDVFTHLIGSTCSEALTTADDVIVPVDQFIAHLCSKHWWVPEANMEPIHAQLLELFEGHRIDYLCPSYGRPVAGAAAVERTYRLMAESLDTLESRQESR